MGRFSLTHPELVEFKKHLKGFNGGYREDRSALAIVTDVLKCLKFLNPWELCWEGLVDATGLRRFLDTLADRSMGPPGLLAKLNSIEQGLRFIETRISSDPELARITAAGISGVRSKMQVSRVGLRSFRVKSSFVNSIVTVYFRCSIPVTTKVTLQ